jgi:hypothetical protein
MSTGSDLRVAARVLTSRLSTFEVEKCPALSVPHDTIWPPPRHGTILPWQVRGQTGRYPLQGSWDAPESKQAQVQHLRHFTYY